MPNWVINDIRVGNADATRDCVKGEKDTKYFDFEEVIPMPDDIFRGDLSMEERIKYGDKNWYDWSIKNWGTKWNADSYYRTGPFSFSIQTAWATPEPIIKELSKKYKCLVEVSYADEDMGYNCGTYAYENGKMVNNWMPPSGSEEARRFACEVWGSDYDETFGEDF